MTVGAGCGGVGVVVPCVRLGGIIALFALGIKGTLSIAWDFERRSLSAFNAICLKQTNVVFTVAVVYFYFKSLFVT